MKYIKFNRILILIFVCVFTSQSFSQLNRTSYFMDKYTHRHVLNPAMTPKHGYFYLPGLGPLSLGVETNMGISTFLFPLSNSNRLGTFLHPEVSSEQFLSKIQEKNTFSFDNTLNILSFGFFAPGGSGFWTFDLGVKTNANLNIPYNFFSFLKNGMSSRNTFYDIKNFKVAVDVYSEAALGYSRDITDELRVGGKVKFLVGVGGAEFNFQKFDIHMSEDAWGVSTLAEGRVYGEGVSFTTDSLGHIDGAKVENMGVGGYGGAIDLGAVYKFEDFRFSFGLTDLGFISYKKDNVKVARADGSVSFTGFDGLNIGDSNKIEGLDGAIDNLKDDLLTMAEFHEIASESKNRFLRTTISAGVEYILWDDKFTAGLLSTTRFGAPRVTTELTLSANLRPVNWFAFSASYSFIASQFGSIGWGLHFTPKWGLNLFLGGDYIPLRVTPQFIPVKDANFNFYFGLSVPIGCNYNRRGINSEDVDATAAE